MRYGKTMRYSTQICPRFQYATAILGESWTGLILRLLMEGPMRFSELLDQIEVIGDRMLSERLKSLEAEGILVRNVHTESPIRVEYCLTEKGRALNPIVEAIGCWAEQWVTLDPAQVPESANEPH